MGSSLGVNYGRLTTFPTLWISLCIESLFYLFCGYYLLGFNTFSLKQLFVWPSEKRTSLILRWGIDALLLSLALSTLKFIMNIPEQNVIPYQTYNLTFLLPFIFSTCILGPLAEEILFRGYFQKQLTVMKGATKALIITAFVFGFAHSHIISIGVRYLILFKKNALWLLPNNFIANSLLTISEAILFHGLTGLFFGYLMWHYQSLWPAVISHGINNLFILLAFSYSGLEKWLIHFGMNETVFFPYIVLLATLGLLLYRLKINPLKKTTITPS